MNSASSPALVGTPPLPVYRIPDEGVRQRNVCEDRCQTPNILVICSVENFADPACGVQFPREAVHHADPRCESHLIPGLFPHTLHCIVPNKSRPPCAFRAALHMMTDPVQLSAIKAPPFSLFPAM